MATKTLTHGDYTVGWVCALPKEQTAALAMLDEKHADLSKQQNDPNVYTLGRAGRHNVVIACLPMGMIGNNKAANVAAHMVSTFPSIKFGLMVGIGGGVPPNVRLGDVVVSKPVSEYSGVVQWDFGKAEQGGSFRRTGALNNPPSALLAALTKLESKHDMEGSDISQYLEDLKMKWPKLIPKYIKSDSLEDVLFVADHSHRRQTRWQVIFSIILGAILGLLRHVLGPIFAPGWSHPDGVTPDINEEGEDDCRFCNKSKVIKRKPRDMRVHYGLIASGNQVIKDAIRRDEINKMLGGNVLCFEMEAAGLMNDFPCLVIRGICDYADSHKNKNWQEHAAAVAAAFAKEFLSVVPAQEVDMMPTIKSLHEGIEKISKDVDDMKQRQISQEENNEEQQRSQLHQLILNWLTPTDYSSQQSDFIGRRQEGTGEWLLASNKFQTWVDQPKRIIFCPGIPGAGKTIATSIVIDHLHRIFRNDVGVGVAYVYCNFRQHQTQHPKDLLLSLLKQFIRGVPSVPICVERLYEDHTRKETRPTFEEITDVFFSVVAGFSRTFIIVDALDECNISDGARSKFMSTIFDIHARTHANIFATSRFIPDIKKEFEKRGSDWLEIRATDEDVRRYLDGHKSQLRSFVLEDPELEEKIKATIVKAADGMFLLAKLHLDSLEDKINLTQVEHALEKLPSGSDAYDQAYEEAMERVQGQKRGFRDLAIQALLWITCTKRPLAKLELQHALATTENASSIDRGNITEVELIVSVCAGLITVDEESGIIRLIHYTTQDFFERTQKPYFMNAQEQIARTCITYLSFDEFGSGFCKTNDGFEARTYLNPLYNYAAHYWGDHTKGTLLEEGSLILSFLESQAKVAAASQAMFPSKWPEDRDNSQAFPKGLTGLHLAAHLGLSNTTIILLKRGSCLNAQNGDGWTPLWMAARAGQDAVVELFLAEYNIDCDTGDERYKKSPLSIAAEHGHASVVELFLVNSVANPNSMDDQGRTPLAWAALNGHRDVMKLLLARQGIQADSKDTYGETPLWLAANHGHKEVVELLLGINGVDPDAPSNSHQTPLSAAARYGYKDVVSLLITCGDVNVNVKDKNGQTALFSASVNGHESVVKLLLTYDNIDKDATNTDGRTPLSVAAGRGHFTIVESLLKAGADPTLKDRYGWSPLLWASANDHRNVMHLLQATDDARGNGKQQKGHKQWLPTADTGRNDSLFKDYYIAWICAFPIELAAARGMLDVIHVDLTKHPKDDYVYLLGLRAALLVGIGGCAPTKEHDIRLGDVVVGAGSSGLVLYDEIDSGPPVTPIRPPSTLLTAITILKSHHVLRGSLIPAFISEMGAKHSSMSANFTSCPKQPDQLFEAGYKHIGVIGNCEKCDVTRLISRPPRTEGQPVIHYGKTIANPFLICLGRTKEAVSINLDVFHFSKTDTYGWSEDFPMLAIQGIWNYDDSHTNGYWRKYAAATAAAYAKELLRKVPLEDILDMQAATIAPTNRNGDANGIMPPNHKTPDNDDEEEDYMSMIIQEPATQQRETLTQRKLRKQRESEAKARIPSKAERAAAEAARRENALNESVLHPSNKGFQMMAKLGFKPGDRLGRRSPPPAPPAPPATLSFAKSEKIGEEETDDTEPNAVNEGNENTAWVQSRAEPLRLIIKEDRGGIGLDSEKKRKFRQETDHVSKKPKADEGEYRDRMRAEREERRCEGLVVGAQKVLEKLETDDMAEKEEEKGGGKKVKGRKEKPLKEVNVLYRGVVRERLEREREKLARMVFEDSLSTMSETRSHFPKPRLPKFNSENGEDEPHAIQQDPKEGEGIAFVEQSLDSDEEAEEDEALNEFNALPSSEKLSRLWS
ncbi:hypothetical protein TCE0_033f09754 [Talaromyces pinophilus]|uniref:Uncharacterized protein n=1 Tax=Talaromyces pinophilus TaxID=128442 RepID=A0A6V8HBD3_TALPI|nr:hypothetical protein TCE0_033f09754 [Talaromyces pinophilus]